MSTTASTSTSPDPIPAILERMLQIIESSPPDPIAAQMTKAGFSPDKGGILILPASLRGHDWGPFGPPKYVRFSAAISEPMYAFDQLRF